MKPHHFLFLISPVSALCQEVWALRTNPSGYSLQTPAGKPGLYLIPSDGWNETGLSVYLRSTNGVLWTTQELPNITVPLACHNGRFVGIGYTSSGTKNQPWFTDNGTSFTRSTLRDTPLSSDFSPLRITWGNSIWLIADTRGRLLRSIDNAATWQLIQTQTDDIDELLFANGKFVAFTSGATLQSTDGQTWTIEAAAPPGDVCAMAGRFFSSFHSSTDGVTWNELSASEIRPVETKFPRASATGLLTWTFTAQPYFHYFNGNQWTGPFPSGVVSRIKDAALCGDLWIAHTFSNKVLTSPTPALTPPTAPALTIAPAVRLTWTSQTGRNYVIQGSSNQTAWTDATGAMLGTGGVMEWTAPASASREFFRVQVR